MTPDTVQQLIGRTMSTSDVVDDRRWAAYQHYFGIDAGRERPLALHWLLFTELLRELRTDGHPVQMLPFPTIPMPRRMWAGGNIVWHAPLMLGERLTRNSEITRAEMKTGGSGPFLLASVQHTIVGSSGPLIEERQDVVFLSQESQPGAGKRRDSSFVAEWSVGRSHSTVDLFQYSALTLNSHRIHYDSPYTTGFEGYPALVVHGPLLATQLMQESARRRSGAPRSLDYRAVAPVFVDEACSLTGRSRGSSDDLAVLGGDGGVRFTATACY